MSEGKSKVLQQKLQVIWKNEAFSLASLWDQNVNTDVSDLPHDMLATFLVQICLLISFLIICKHSLCWKIVKKQNPTVANVN